MPFCFSILISFILFPFQMAFGGSLYLTWHPKGESDLKGYKIYHRASSGSYGEPLDVGNVTSFELTGLEEGRTYYVALSAYDTSLNESEKCGEVSGVATVSSNTSTSTTTTIVASGTELQNGITDNGLLAQGEEDHYYIYIPTNQSYLFVELMGNPDADLYVRHGSIPTLALWDCRPYTADSSNENCSFTGPDSGRWYIMARGYSGAVDYEITATYGTGSPPQTTTTIPPTTTIPGNDTTPPTGSVTINNDLMISYSRNVILTLSASDEGVELKKNGWMTFSNDNQEWSDPEPYTTGKLWSLSPNQGIKTVYVKFGDAAGNWMMTPAEDQIIFEESENACDAPQRLLPNATAVSSQLLPFYSKDNAVDGNPSTSWSTFFSFFKKDEFITLDLGAMKRISWFSMQAASTLFGTDYFPVNFKLEISSDNMTWEEISNEQGYSPPLLTSHPESWDFKSLECRYIRVSINKAKSIFLFFRVARIAEIEVYGCDITAGQLPMLTLQDSVNKEETATHEVSDQENYRAAAGEPSIPGKPVVTFIE
jgi:hypothetical protein